MHVRRTGAGRSGDDGPPRPRRAPLRPSGRATPGLAGDCRFWIADFRLLMDIGRTCHTTFSIVNHQSAIDNALACGGHTRGTPIRQTLGPTMGAATTQCHGAERRSNFRFCRTNAGMLLKTKDRAWKAAGKAGMSMKTKEISAESGNIVEKKGGRW